MARMPRAVIPGYPHHVTQRGVRSMDVFRDDNDRQLYLSLLAAQSARFGLDILAWCLMSNHIHLVALPKNPESLSRALGEAHRRYTRHVNRSVGVRGHLFQERFHSCPMDAKHLLAAARYVELNPVKAGLVRRAENWPWSSARFHLGIVRQDPLVTDATLLGLVPSRQWPHLLRQKERVQDETLLRHVRTGRPAGDGAFVSNLEKLSGKQMTVRKPGRPRKKAAV
jgi:putative transposase